ncbi:AI-2E family transporter YdiK [Caballeronia sp. LP006]|jgi:predicted PurR-regulated permease PerM|uniref:AI-2E family transporter YdiK n=1 Tax=unclassified Caballeronia TaxID=2646786 RepID=UPI001FD02851|nr:MULTISPECIES: AI-2E family transporter YdiK [unclassified Caballeronia]MDR5775174.1 AI-2E family transporter YdiK [Caballeronia sp. LZ002]MDR5800835.1 AI-2E family transporter YdiK [Caballeronia sp. LZ001]MDR5829036.1 AI-2E family transporter YdiK [Caballeronia sp. LP006]MDR5850612.1 AI-2E family transporter YdiK [Caballeronia sp. LZ003]
MSTTPNGPPNLNPRQPVDIARILLVIAILTALTVGSLYILRPFLPGLIWATTIVVATWPLMVAVQRRCGNRRWAATTVMLLVLLIVIVLPLYQAISTLALHGAEIMSAIKSLPTYALPPPPSWVHDVPLAGQRVSAEWQTLSDAGPGGLLARIEPYVTIAARWMLSHAAVVGVFVMHMVITIIISGILYMQGEAAGRFIVRFATRVAAQRGAEAIKLAGLAIRAVALGIVVTAVTQSALGGIGLWIAGVPAAGIITAVMLMLCLAQIGPLLPLLGGVAWLFWHGSHVAAILLLIWSIMIAMLDNFLRPILIRRGINLSMLLILSGVLGGMFAFGIVGLFIGPVILAVTSAILNAWINEQPSLPQVDAMSKEELTGSTAARGISDV